jgi:hypothetical protein
MESPPRVFHYSLDWRFLLPTADAKKLCLLLEENEEFSHALDPVGLRGTQQVSFLDLKDDRIQRFDSLAMPFGLSTGWAGKGHAAQVEFYVSIRRLLSSGGYFLVGFNNTWNLRASSPEYYSSTPHRMAEQLKEAGFQSVKLFGAMPNLNIPEYIFETDSRTIQFALQNRFRRKPVVVRALRALSGTIGMHTLSNFLPCYFAVAAA